MFRLIFSQKDSTQFDSAQNEQQLENSSDLRDKMTTVLETDIKITDKQSEESELKFPNDIVAESTKNVPGEKSMNITIIPTKSPISVAQCSDTVTDCPDRAKLCDSKEYGNIM